MLPKADRRVRLGHAWIFSNEIDVARTPLTKFAPGDVAEVRDARGKPVGVAYVNPNALICARVLTSDAKAKIDSAWWALRISRALDLRQRLYPVPYYRAVYGESDGCPGLVIDRYGEVFVVQLNTAGTVAMREQIVEAIARITKASGLLLRTSHSVRALEDIDALDQTIGVVPDVAQIPEGETIVAAPLRGGQKTGYFYDQRDNRSRLARYADGKSVLDLYSYVGAWGLRAARFGAASVTCVDSSVSALEFVRENAIRNGLQIEAERGDALDVLQTYANQRRRFDVIVLDPPALIQRRRDISAGQALYERLNRSAFAVLERDGILVSCSCSHHLEPARLQRTILQAARDAGRRPQILERHAHAPDHPIHPAMPETEYLKAFFVRA